MSMSKPDPRTIVQDREGGTGPPLAPLSCWLGGFAKQTPIILGKGQHIPPPEWPETYETGLSCRSKYNQGLEQSGKIHMIRPCSASPASSVQRPPRRLLPVRRAWRCSCSYRLSNPTMPWGCRFSPSSWGVWGRMAGLPIPPGPPLGAPCSAAQPGTVLLRVGGRPGLPPHLAEPRQVGLPGRGHADRLHPTHQGPPRGLSPQSARPGTRTAGSLGSPTHSEPEDTHVPSICLPLPRSLPRGLDL